MKRHALFLVALLLAWVRAAAPGAFQATPQPAEQPDRELRFLQGLRERGYFDLATEYIDGLLKNPRLSADLRGALAYEASRGLLEEATSLADLDRRQSLLEKARVKLDEFTRNYADHRLASEALVQFARLNVERGHTNLLRAGDTKTEDEQGKPIAAGRLERETRLTAARSAFGEARAAYDKAETRLKADYDAFPKFIPEGDPRKAARDRAHTALMDNQLQRAIVDYEEAQTYPPGSTERVTLLDSAATRFEDLYKRYRTQLAGLHARMLQAKCLEEKGELGPAMGYYNEFKDHQDPNLLPLKRQVEYYRIIVTNKRKEHALAVDEAARWLAAYPNHHTTEEGLGVKLEMARGLLAQLDQMPESERERALRTATDRLKEVVRYYSPHKPEALRLLNQYQPKAAVRANQIVNLTYEDAIAQAETAINTRDWPLAEALLQQAVRRAQRSREQEKINRARFFLAYVYYASERYYEAAAIADHLVARYPEAGLAPQAAEVGLASLNQAYLAFPQVDRESDLQRMIALARLTAERWPETEQADSARLTLGDIYMGRGEYPQAAEALELVRAESPRHLEALVKAGDAHWRQSRLFREQGESAQADAEASAAEERVTRALRGHEQAASALTDPGRIATANALAEIFRATNRPQDAISLLEPFARAFADVSAAPEVVPLYSSTLSILLRAYLAAGQPNQAIATMRVLEKLGSRSAALTQLYFELGRTLKSELEALDRQNDPRARKRTEDAFRQFLSALAQSEAGQSYESLQWAGESMLNLNMPAEAAEVFQRVLSTVAADESFLAQKDATTRILRTRLKLAVALRDQKKFDAARDLVQTLIDENPRLLEPQIEKGYLLEARAVAENSSRAWQDSLAYWKDLALKLRQSRQSRTEGFEAWLHVARALEGLNRKSEAISTLKGIMTMTPSLGGPEMQAKYQEAMARLSK